MLESIKSNKELYGIFICVASAIIFGLYPVTAKAVYADGGNFAAVVFIVTFCRFLGLYIGALLQKERILTSLSQSKPVLISGVFQGISVAGVFGAAYFLPGAIVIIIMFTYSLMHLFYSSYKGLMKLNKINLSLTVLALFGLACSVDAWGAQSAYSPYGYALAFLAAVATFIRTFIYAQQGQKRSPMVVGAESFLVATTCLLLVFVWQHPVLPKTSYGYVMLGVCCVSMVLGTYGMFYGLAYLGAYKFSMITKLEPVFTALFGVILLGNVLSFTQYFGIIIVVGSLVALQIFDKQKTS